MTDKLKTVIIGSGIGGLATACYLAQNGYQVELFEKNANPGGRCGQIVLDGHRFDLGATLLMMPSIYRTVLNDLGIDLEKDLDAIQLDPVYKIFYSDGSSFYFSPDNEVMRSQLESMEPGSFQKYMDYISEGYSFFNLATKDLLARNFENLPSFINLKNTRLLMKLKTYCKHSQYVQKFFNDPRLQMAFTFQNIYVGQSPFNAPAFFSMLPGAEVTEGAWFPKGGMHRIVEKLLEKATSEGVSIHYKAQVDRIITNCNNAEGILLQNGTRIYADLVVGNADLPYIYRELLQDKKTTQILKKKKYSCSAIVFHWGVSKVYPQLEHHTIFLNDPFKKGLDAIFRDKTIGDNPSFYIHAPTRSDQYAAPENHDTLTVVVPAAHLDEQAGQDWKKIKKKARSAVIRRLKEAGVTDIEEHIKFEICFLPKTWESTCNISNGAVFGSLAHKIFQMGYFRPQNRHRKYKNLYFTGGSTHPGNGIPLVLLSAKLTTERILKDLSN